MAALYSDDDDRSRSLTAACGLASASRAPPDDAFGESNSAPHDGIKTENAHQIVSLLHEWRARVLENTGALPRGFVSCTSRYVGALVNKRLKEVTREEALLRDDLASLELGTEEQTTI